MSRMDRLILQEVVGPFFLSAILFTGLFFAGGEIIRLVEFLQGGQSAIVVAQLVLLTLPGVLALTFPMAMLLAALLGFGRLSSDSEIISLTAAGVNFGRIALPVAFFGLLVSLVGLWFNNQIVPAASRGRNVIIDRFKSEGGSLNTDQALTFPLRDKKGILTTLVHVEGGANLASGEMSNVAIIFYERNKPKRFFSAPRATWKMGTKTWTLYDVQSATLGNESEMSVVASASGLRTEEINLDSPDQLAALQGRPEDTDTSKLRERSRILRAGGNIHDARTAEVEVARRGALPFASLAFALIGAPLGVRPQRGGAGVGFGLSVVITFIYWILLQAASVVAKGGTLPANISLMLPNLICIGAGIYLIRRVLR